MRSLFLTALLILLTLCVFAQDTTVMESTTYLVYRQSFFPQDRYKTNITPVEFKYFIATGKTSIAEAGGQPFAKTEYSINYSGKYALWTVSPQSEDKSHIKTMVDKGYILKLSEQRLVRNDDVTEMHTVQLASLPTDYYAVQITTTTGD